MTGIRETVLTARYRGKKRKKKKTHIHSRTGGEKMGSQEEAVNSREVF